METFPNSCRRAAYLIAGLLIAGLLLMLPARALTLQDFIQCIGPQGRGPVCQLDAGTYLLTTPLSIGRSNITIKGTISQSLADTTLKRAPGSTRALMAAYDESPNLTSITIRDFTFDGARDPQSATANSFEPDLRLISLQSLLITNAAFVNSPGIAITFEGAPGQSATSGAVINNISVDNAALLGIWAYAIDGPSDTPGKYLTCDSLAYPTSITITNSTFTNIGANAIALEARRAQVSNNTLRHNHQTAPFNAPGGQVYVQICSDDVAVEANEISDGPATANGWYADGIELHGTNLSVVDNRVIDNAGSGIAMSAVQDVFIANWTLGTGVIGSNLVAGNVGGISVYNAAPGDVNERQVDLISIDHAISIDGQLAGIGIFLQTGQTNPIRHVTITNNCLAGNRNGSLSVPGIASDAIIANNLSSGCPQ